VKQYAAQRMFQRRREGHSEDEVTCHHAGSRRRYRSTGHLRHRTQGCCSGCGKTGEPLRRHCEKHQSHRTHHAQPRPNSPRLCGRPLGLRGAKVRPIKVIAAVPNSCRQCQCFPGQRDAVGTAGRRPTVTMPRTRSCPAMVDRPIPPAGTLMRASVGALAPSGTRCRTLTRQPRPAACQHPETATAEQLLTCRCRPRCP